MFDGAENNGTGVLNATYNWWGAPTGPSDAGPGDGVPVSENVTVEPFLDAPYPDGEAIRPTTFSIVEFDVEDDSVPVGERTNLTVSVENTGDVPGVKPITISVTEPESSARTLTEFGVEGGVPIAPGDTFNVTVPVAPSGEFQGKDVTLELDATDDRATDTVSVTESDTLFEVVGGSTEIDPESEAGSGERITVNATIENTGNATGSQTIELVRKNGSDEEIVDSVDATLAGDGEETVDVSLTDAPPVIYEGETLSYNVSTPVDDVNVSAIEILESAAFSVTGENVTDVDSIVSGDAETVEATINNTGDVIGTGTVTLAIDGSTVARTDVESVAGDSGETVTLELDAGGVAPGTREVALQTDNDTVRHEITVDAPAEFVPTVESVTDPVAGDDIAVDVGVENVGDEPASTNVTLAVAGIGTNTTTTSSISGSETVTLELDTNESDAGTRSLFVSTNDRTVENETTVLEPADLGVDIVSATDPLVATQDTLSADIEITNDGGVGAGSVSVALALDGESEDSTTVPVPGDGETTATFEGIDVGEALEGDLELNATATHDGATVADTETVTVLEAPDEALFRVADLNVTDTTARSDVLRVDGGTLEVNATIENVGDVEGTQDVAVIADGVTQSQSLTIGGGENTTVGFALDPSELRTGDRSIDVETENSDQTSRVTVRDPEPPTVEVAAIDAGDGLEEGDSVTATVENVGDLDADRTVAIDASVGSEAVGADSESVTLAPGETTTVDVAISSEETLAGNFTTTVEVDTGNGTEATETTVDFGTIADALDEAETGDTVSVAAGTYEESVTVDTSGVTLSGADSTLDTDGTAIEVTATDVTIENFAFRNASVGVDTTADRTTVRTSRFLSSVTNGTEIDGADARIENNRFGGLEYALVLTGGANNATIVNNNILDSSERGLFATAGIHRMHNNNIERNEVAIEANRPDSDSVTEIDATNNYWGRPGGPITQGPNAEILSPVRVRPFLTDPNESPDYRITDSNLSEIDDVVEGETVEVTYTVENVGGTAGNDIADTLVLELDGDRVAATDAFEIGAGGTAESGDELETLTFQVDAATAATLDTADLRLSTADDSSSKSVGVLTAPDFEATIDDAPAELEAGQTLSVDATVENVGEAAGTGTVTLTFDGTTVASTGVSLGGGATTPVTLETGLDSGDVGTDVPVDVLPTDGSTVAVTVTSAPEPSGPGGGGGDAPAATEPQEIALPAETVVASDSEPLVDAEPGRSGIQVSFDGTETVSEISFENEGLSATTTVEVTEGSSLPGTVAPPSGSVAEVAEVTVPARIENERATLRFRVPAEGIDADPSEIEVHRYDEGSDSWSTLETSVVGTDGGVIELEAETPGFSLFAVVAPDTDEAVSETPTPDGTTDDDPGAETPADEPVDGTPGDEPDTDTPVEEPAELPGFGPAVAVVALLAAALLARRDG